MVESKLLRRTTWCREQDFDKKIQRQALASGYHRANWELITVEFLQKRASWQILQGEDIIKDPFFSERELRVKSRLHTIITPSDQEKFARQYIDYLLRNQRLYNPKWRNWSWKYLDDTISIRYNVTHDWAPLGLVTLERDY